MSKETKLHTKIEYKLDKVLSNKKTFIFLDLMFVILSMTQIILFSFNLIDYNGISFGENDMWRAYASLSIVVVGLALVVRGGTKSSQRDKNFFIYSFIAFTIFTLDALFLGLFFETIKMSGMLLFLIFQKVQWNKHETKKIVPKNLGWWKASALYILALGAGLAAGYGILHIEGLHYAHDWIAYVDGMHFMAAIVVLYMISQGYKESYFFDILNMIMIMTIFTGVGQWASMLEIMFTLLFIKTYGLLSWNNDSNFVELN